jgi:hypothetical protein
MVLLTDHGAKANVTSYDEYTLPSPSHKRKSKVVRSVLNLASTTKKRMAALIPERSRHHLESTSEDISHTSWITSWMDFRSYPVLQEPEQGQTLIGPSNPLKFDSFETPSLELDSREVMELEDVSLPRVELSALSDKMDWLSWDYFNVSW